MSRPHFAECTMGKVAAESATDGIDTRMRFSTIAPPRALFPARMSQAEVRHQTGSVDVRRVRPSTRARCRAAKGGVP